MLWSEQPSIVVKMAAQGSGDLVIGLVFLALVQGSWGLSHTYGGITWNYEAIGKGQIRFDIKATNIATENDWFGVGISKTNSLDQGYMAFKGSRTRESFVKSIHKNHSAVDPQEHMTSGFILNGFNATDTEVEVNLTTQSLELFGVELHILFFGPGKINENGTFELSTQVPEISSKLILQLRDAPNDIPKPLPLSCFFATSLNVTQNVSLIISKRCRDHTWMKTVSSGSKKQIHVDNQRCGVRDALNESLATSSDLCTSAQGEGAIVSFKHKIRISNFNFTKDLGDLRKSTFKGRKRRIELDWTDIFLNPENPFVEWGFERVSVLSFEPGPSQNGLFVNAIVQFGPEAVGKNATEDYKTAWEALGVTDLGKFTLDQAFELIAEQDTCPPLSMMEKWVPSEIWSASNVTGNERIPMGQTVDFQCPLNKKLSFDNDTFVWNDDKYSVLCNPFLKYTAMEEPAWWPKCGKFCWMRLPTPPEYSGLEPIIPPNTISVGQYGKYQCKNTSLGVERGPSIEYQVRCLANERYRVPTLNNWPVCFTRTTTVSPVLRIAIETQRQRRMEELNEKHMAYQWREGDEHYVEPLVPDHFTHMTIPVAMALLLLISCCCFCTHKNSPCCSICEDKTKRVKYMVPLKTDDP